MRQLRLNTLKRGQKSSSATFNEADAAKTSQYNCRGRCGTAKFQRTDVTVETEVAALMETADTEFGRIDTLVTSAGVLRGPSVRIDDFEAGDF